MKARRIACLFSVGLLFSVLWTPSAALGPERIPPIEAVKAAFVSVEIWLQFDKGEEPGFLGSGGRYYSGRFSYPVSGGLGDLVQQDRPLEFAGILLSPSMVVTTDIHIHPRFIQKIVVRRDEESVEATPSAYLLEQNGLILDLAAPLKEGEPLTFNSTAEGPYYAVSFYQANCRWNSWVEPVDKAAMSRDGKEYRMVPPFCVLVDKEGTPVGMCMKTELPLDDAWKGSPLSLARMPVKEWGKTMSSIADLTDACLVRVQLHFRSPEERERIPFSFEREEGESPTEQNVIGALIGGHYILILAYLKPDVTARLERIQVYLPGRNPQGAKFLCTLADYAAFVAQLECEVRQNLTFSSKEMKELRNKILCFSQILVQGDERVAYHSHGRFDQIEFGWKRQEHPAISGESGCFLFDTDGNLVALPLGRRILEGPEERWGRYRSADRYLLAVGILKPILNDLAAHADKSNVPLSEKEENRLAWLGVVLQPMTRELAQVNNVSDLTKGGSTGGLVSFVYPGSPAMEGGIQVGDILLRLHIPGKPKPVHIQPMASQHFPGFDMDVPPEVFDEFMEESGYRFWPSVDTPLNRTLTELGFGKPFEVELVANGNVVRKKFTVTQSPLHYDSAPRFRSTVLGLRVRNLTYEVRTYFQMKDDDPGVIVSKVDKGKLAAVSGIQLYDIITHIEDQPVTNVDDFSTLIKEEGERRLSVKRRTKMLIVKVKMPKEEKEK